MQTVLITGISGFVGTLLSKKLLPYLRVIGLSSKPKMGFINADLAKKPKIALQGVDVIVHIATALPEFFKKYPGIGHRINVGGTKLLLKAAKKAHVKRFIYVSTAGVYQRSATMLTEDSPRKPFDKYTQSKEDAEHDVLRYAKYFDVSIAYLFFPYGRGQPEARLVSRIISSVKTGKPISVNDDGGPRLSLTYVDDLAEALKRLVLLHNPPLRIMIAGKPVSIKEIATTAGELLHQNPIFTKNLKQELDMVADVRVMKKFIGYTAQTSLSDGLRKVIL